MSTDYVFLSTQLPELTLSSEEALLDPEIPLE